MAVLEKLEKGTEIRHDGQVYTVLEHVDNEILCTLKSFSSPRYRFSDKDVRVMN